MLQRASTESLERDVKPIDIAIRSTPLSRCASEVGDHELVARVASAMALAQTVSDVHTCVVRPAPMDKDKDNDKAATHKQAPDRVASSDDRADRALAAWFATPPRVTMSDGQAWSVRFVRGSCAPAP